MVWVVAAVAYDQTEVVPGFCQRCGDAQVAGEPVVVGLIPLKVAVSRVHEDTQRLSSLCDDELRVGVAAGHLNEAADRAADALELVRTQPSGSEGTVATTAAAADRPSLQASGVRISPSWRWCRCRRWIGGWTATPSMVCRVWMTGFVAQLGGRCRRGCRVACWLCPGRPRSQLQACRIGRPARWPRISPRTRVRVCPGIMWRSCDVPMICGRTSMARSSCSRIRPSPPRPPNEG
jgi:hypothetical protein